MPRVSDLEALAASTSGKVEIESLEEGREGQIVENLVKARRAHRVQGAVDARSTSATSSPPSRRASSPTPARTSPSAELAGLVEQRARRCASRSPSLTGGDESPAAVATAVEFVLEGLHLSKRLNKDAAGARATYRGRG